MQKDYECPYAQFFEVELVVKLLCKTLLCQLPIAPAYAGFLVPGTFGL
jgi:hypothetical protein